MPTFGRIRTKLNIYFCLYFNQIMESKIAIRGSILRKKIVKTVEIFRVFNVVIFSTIWQLNFKPNFLVSF